MWSSIIIFPHRHSYTDGRSIVSPIFDVNQQVLTDLSFVALLLTFGAVFPPLAVVIMFCIVLRNITTRIHMGKVVIDYIDSDDDIKLSIIEEECGDLPSLRDICRYGWIVIFIASGFFSFFLFDVLGDVVGLSSSYWVLIVMPALPLFIYMCFRLYDVYNNFTLSASAKTTSPPLVFDHRLEIDVTMMELSNETAAVMSPDCNLDNDDDYMTSFDAVGLADANFITDYDLTSYIPLYDNDKLSKQFSVLCNYGDIEKEDDNDDNTVARTFSMKTAVFDRSTTEQSSTQFDNDTVRSHSTDKWTPCRSRSIKTSLLNRSRMERIEFEDSCSDSNRRGSCNNDSINQSMQPVDEEENAVELVGSLMRGNSQKSVGSLEEMRGRSQK